MTPELCLRGIQTKLSRFGVYPESAIDGTPGPLTDMALAALQAAFSAFSPATGKMSTFGGPDDSGVSPSEGLWCFPEDRIPAGFEWLFLPSQPSGTSGLARRLNPDQPYIACRWFGKTTVPTLPRQGLRLLRWRVSANGKSIDCIGCDWGPAASTGRIADLSPGAANYLGVETDDVVSVALAT